MISEDARERMRRAYSLEKQSLRQVAREEGYCRETIKKATSDAPGDHTRFRTLVLLSQSVSRDKGVVTACRIIHSWIR